MKGNLLKTIFFSFLVFAGWEAFGHFQNSEVVLHPAVNSYKVSGRFTSITPDIWDAKEYRGRGNDSKSNKESKVSKWIFALNENGSTFSTGINLSLFEI